MRKCCACKKVKQVSEFHTNTSRKDGMQGACIECNRLRNKEYYRQNKDRARERRTRATEKLKNEIRFLKETNPCTDCSNYYPYYVMDFDHLDGASKIDSIAKLTGDGSREQVFKEMSKCELVCANCHRVRTHKRFMGLVL